jgi:hypothetical protein
MKDADDMDQAVETAPSPRPMISKLADFLLLLLACGGLGYCVGKLIAGGDFAVSDGLIIVAATGIIFGLIQRSVKGFPQANRKQESLRLFRQISVGAFIGMAGMGSVIWLMGDRLEQLADQMQYWNLAAVFLSVMYILFAAIVALLAANKKMMNVKPGDEPLSDDEFADTRPMLFWAAMGLLAYGLILGITAFSSSNEGAPNWFALAALITALAGQLSCSFILWRRYDELYREVTRTACAVSYIVVEAIVIIWAGLTMFGFPVRFDPMAVLVVMMTIALITTITISVRRGLN